MINFLRATTDEEYRNAALLFKEYAASLDIDLDFQHFDMELREINKMYSLPEGGIILCKSGDEYIGCVGIRKLDRNTAEIKRMFIKPAYQKQGLGKSLLQQAVKLAKTLNYTAIRLDTLNHMAPAIKLYRQFGFYEIPAYYNNPNATAIYFEMKC